MKTFAMLAVILLASGPVLAQQPAATAPGPAPKAAGDASGVAGVDQRAARLHQQLKITPEQEPAWKAFEQAMRDNVTSTDKVYKDRSTSLATMSAVDNMKNFAQIEQARAQGVQNLATAFETLYNGLSDDQKKTADAVFRQYGEQRAAKRNAPK